MSLHIPRRAARLLSCFLVAGSTCLAQYRYDKPTPLPSTPQHHPAERAILINIEGMHAIDMALWIQLHPHSALAQLAARGVLYTNARVPYADGAVGRAAIATGGTPITTGIISSSGWDRTLSPPGSHCATTGAPIEFNSRVDAASNPAPAIDRSKLPLDPQHGCAPVYPHNYLLVNTAFELVRHAGGRTAWADENPAIADLYNGPSGAGVDDIYAPEANRSGAPMDLPTAIENDMLRVRAVQNEIAGRNHAGTRNVGVPRLFGMTFIAVKVSQQQPGEGYLNASGEPSSSLNTALRFVDASLGTMISDLKARELYNSTFFFVTSAYGQTPMDPKQRRVISRALIEQTVDSIQPGLAAHVTAGTGALIWLRDPLKAPAVVSAFRAKYRELGIAHIYPPEEIALRFNPPAQDPRMPDIMLEAEPGVLWDNPESAMLSGHRGQSNESVNVPVLVSGQGLTGRIDKTEVPTSQVAPAILKSLGMEKFGLLALHGEHTPAIPDIF